ncbi:hypothetical protein LOD99_9617 [Oopsacas minuta]|uniref:Odorant receptor n=1 Tax=Oopsacas minuta TaxID=111878 RepID=A0AAV7KMQ4_9METZ|nr:hypothetical protein LOD99_9617 [Oopsacas minuta]
MFDNLFGTQKSFLRIVLYLDLVWIFPIFVTFICWNIVIINRIKGSLKFYNNAIIDSINDSTGYSKEQAFNYMTDYVKYWYLLLINFSELAGSLLYVLGFTITELLWDEDQKVEFPNQFQSSNCSLDLYQNLPVRLITETPAGLVCIALAQSAMVSGMAFSICLMKYLEWRYLYPSRNSAKWKNRFLQITGVIVFLFITLGSIPQTVILHRIIEPVTQIAYFVIFARQARIFYKISKSMALDHRITSQDERSYKLTLYSAYQFGIGMLGYSFGYLCLILSEIFSYTSFHISTILYYSPCLLHYLYGIQVFQPIIHTSQDIAYYKEFFFSISIVSRSFIVLGTVALVTQFVLFSLVYLTKTILLSLKSRSEKGLRTRFTPSLTNPLLFQHQIDTTTQQ